MAEFRWLLLALGILVIAGVYAFTRFSPQIKRTISRPRERREPGLNSVTDGVAEKNDQTSGVTIQAPASVPMRGDDPPPSMESTAAKVVAIRLVSKKSPGFPADKLILSMRELGLRHGQFGIFHASPPESAERPDFSIASLSEPGSFDLTQIKTTHYPGVSIFLALPGAKDGLSRFDKMLETSRELAARLNGELLDEQGSALSIQRERYMREEVIHFEHHLDA